MKACQICERLQCSTPEHCAAVKRARQQPPEELEAQLGLFFDDCEDAANTNEAEMRPRAQQ